MDKKSIKVSVVSDGSGHPRVLDEIKLELQTRLALA